MKNLYTYLLCLFCAAGHNAYSMQSQEEPAQKRARAASTHNQECGLLTSTPLELMREITSYLPTHDMTSLARTCRTCKEAIHPSSGNWPGNLLARRLAKGLIYQAEDPIALVRNRAQGQPTARLHGCQVPTHEVLNTLYESIVEILTAKEIDPISYVCQQAQGNPTVILYGHQFDTIKILRALTAQGESPLRICSNIPGIQCFDIEEFFNDDQANSIFPSCPTIDVPANFLETLTQEEQLDYVRWVEVTFQGNTMTELINLLDTTCKENPKTGIFLRIHIDNDEFMTIESVKALATYPITALFMEDAHLHEGLAALAPLKHLRILLVEPADDANITDGSLLPPELCQLPELRALDIHTSDDQETTTVAIPADIKNLKKLQYLNLDMFRYDDSIGNLATVPQLRMLKLISPEYMQFPGSLCNCTNLQVLYWHADTEDRTIEKTIIPADIAKLEKLRGLRLSYAEKTTMILPASIGKLRSLTHISFFGSCVAELPQEIAHLQALRFIDFVQCNIAKIPDTLCALPNLSNISLDDMHETFISFETLGNLLNRNALQLFMPHARFLKLVLGLRSALMPYKKSLSLLNKLTASDATEKTRKAHGLMPHDMLNLTCNFLGSEPFPLSDIPALIRVFTIPGSNDIWTADMCIASALVPLALKSNEQAETLDTLVRNIQYTEDPTKQGTANKTSEYALHLMSMKQAIYYAHDLLNPDLLLPERRLEILGHVEEILPLLETIANPSFARESHEFEMASWVIENPAMM